MGDVGDCVSCLFGSNFRFFFFSCSFIVFMVLLTIHTDDSGGSSPCQGRVEVSYEDEEDSTRTLAIVCIFLLFFSAI